MTESVWDYPRPPRVDPSSEHVVVTHAGVVLAETSASLRVLETSHPPTIYIPRADIDVARLTESDGPGSFCEFKGAARYVDAAVGQARAARVGWFYPRPTPGYEQLADHIAFYPGRVDAAWIGEERVTAQEGDFYGGWITSDLAGPFKGPPGTRGW